MVSEGIASHLLAYGEGPSGGLTVSSVLTKEPDLFTAAVLRVRLTQNPLSDVINFQLNALPSTELGGLNSKEDYERLLSYSPYHQQIRPISTAVLVTADDAYFSIQALKLVAKLRRSAGSAPLLYKEFEG